MPISKAIECSTALPIVYKPVELKGRQLVDGGIRSTTNVDIAVEKGAKFIVVVNPLVPFVNDFKRRSPPVGTRVRRVADMGPPAIANQAFRLIAHQRLHQAVAVEAEVHGRRHRPARARAQRRVDVRDAIMDYSRRLQIARHGFESVTATLAQDYDRYKETAEGQRCRDLRAPRPPRRRAGPPKRSRSRPRPGGACSTTLTSALLRGEAS